MCSGWSSRGARRRRTPPATGTATVTPVLLSADSSPSCGPDRAAPWNARAVQRRSDLPHLVGAVATTSSCTFDPGLTEMWRTESNLRWTFVLRRNGAFGLEAGQREAGRRRELQGSQRGPLRRRVHEGHLERGRLTRGRVGGVDHHLEGRLDLGALLLRLGRCSPQRRGGEDGADREGKSHISRSCNRHTSPLVSQWAQMPDTKHRPAANLPRRRKMPAELPPSAAASGARTARGLGFHKWPCPTDALPLHCPGQPIAVAAHSQRRRATYAAIRGRGP